MARWILEKSGCHKPVKRLWISSVTDKAIREGFAHLKEGKEYQNLYAAAVCRAQADWLVGINATRALTCKYNAQLSCGRVQTPTLAMIARREEEIRKFKPQEYYGVSVKAGGIQWTWQDEKSRSSRTFSKEKAQEVQGEVSGKSLKIISAEKKSKKAYAPGLYDLTELQRDANKKFGYSAKQTLNIMQRLYENHKVLTYPRTDSRYIGKDVAGTLSERLKAISIGPYRKLAGPLSTKALKTNASFVDDSKVSDHHAIIPTEQFVQLEHMTTEERKIYDLVVRRFLSVLYPPFVYEQSTLTAKCGNDTFAARGKMVISQGWKSVYENQSEDWDDEEDDERSDQLKDQVLPSLEKNEVLKAEAVKITTGKTKPPAYFNEAALLSAMENPIKYMESQDAKVRKTLGETGGLGTVATRADIIEKLFHSFMMEKRGQEIHLTSKAKQLLELVPEDLKKPELTADWEMRLGNISRGKMKKDAFMENIRDYTRELIGQIRAGEGNFRHDNLTNTKCPVCGKRMLAVNGKNARLLVCQDRTCGHRETVARMSNARCPNCHKKMELIKKGEEEMFVCVCGHKEKLSAFKARREREGAGVSKRDVQKYLSRQKSESVNTPFADAFSKISLDD